MERILFHCSSHFFGESDSITLIPGNQCAQGKGVYFSLGKPDQRASDSCYEQGLKSVIKVFITDPKRLWWTSKGGNDRKKARPQTWHTNGKAITIHVTSYEVKDGVAYIEGTATNA